MRDAVKAESLDLKNVYLSSCLSVFETFKLDHTGSFKETLFARRLILAETDRVLHFVPSFTACCGFDPHLGITCASPGVPRWWGYEIAPSSWNEGQGCNKLASNY